MRHCVGKIICLGVCILMHFSSAQAKSKSFVIDSAIRNLLQRDAACALSLLSVEPDERSQFYVTEHVREILLKEMRAGNLTDIAGFGVGVAIFKDGKVAVAQRNSSVGDGEWGLPGGRFAPRGHETVFSAIRRELKEETGLQVKDLRLLGITLDHLVDDQGKSQTYVSFHVAGDWRAGILEPQKEPKKVKPPGWRWLSWKEIGELDGPLFLTLKKLYESNIPIR